MVKSGMGCHGPGTRGRGGGGWGCVGIAQLYMQHANEVCEKTTDPLIYYTLLTFFPPILDSHYIHVCIRV